VPVSHPPVVDVRRAAFGYEGRPVVLGVDFAMSRGDVVAVLGPNGSGKSTLVRGLLGLVPLLGGTVRIFGDELRSARQHRHVGYVPQRHTVGSGIPSTVQEVVASGRLAGRPPWRRFTTEDAQAIDSALGTVGLAGRARTPVSRLSGGQQRRVLIARALAGDPKLLILDEPMAGVDLANQRQLTDTLAALRSRGTTALVVAHELGPLEPLVTRVVVVQGGRITYDGPPQPGQHAEGAEYHHPHGQPPSTPALVLDGPTLDRPTSTGSSAPSLDAPGSD
jgi:zinc transport system ATP-binding protein